MVLAGLMPVFDDLAPGEALTFLLDSIQGGECEALQLLRVRPKKGIELQFTEGDGWEILSEGWTGLAALDFVVQAAIGEEPPPEVPNGEHATPKVNGPPNPVVNDKGKYPSAQELIVNGFSIAELIPNDVSGVAYTETDLRNLFDALDRNSNGYLDETEFKEFYASLETFGTEPDPRFVDNVLRQYNILGDGKISFDEFSIIMLKVAAR
eukprot:TRINITY_DN15342_c0_g1_i1.p1 TRINITY_DN15342_c0_g1~~TRINITY_DN15342_c0_g1_i1.p1  ORF type:complete len:209 (+),score=45.45 TRINITY_DN15342_c0_g1_i1:171-797(+)